MKQIIPLLVRPPLLADETTNSYLYRISTANLLSTRQLMALVKRHLKDLDANNLHSVARQYMVLSKLIGLEPYKLYWGTEHSFLAFIGDLDTTKYAITLDTGYTFPILPFRGGWIRRRDDLQFCPYCLKETAYQKRAWLASKVSACIKHKCLLVENCSKCSNNLGLQDIMTAKCRICGFPLTKAITVSISNDSKGLNYQKLLYFFLNSGPHVNLPVVQADNRALFTMALFIINKLDYPYLDDQYLHQIPNRKPLDRDRYVQRRAIEKTYVQWTTAVDALTNWPFNFKELVKGYTLRGKPQHAFDQLSNWLNRWREKLPEEKYPSLYPGLDECVFLYSSWKSLNIHRRRNLCPTRTDDITVDHPMFTKFKWVAIPEAQALLKMSDLLLTLLLKHGLIRGVDNINGYFRSSDVVLCKDVLHIKKEWGDNIPLNDVYKVLEISEDLCLGLIHAQVLRGRKGVSLDGKENWFVEQDSVDHLLAQLFQYKKPQWQSSTLPRFCKLGQAVRLLAPFGYDAIKLIELAANGQLISKYRRGQSLREVVFFTPSLTKLINPSGATGQFTSCEHIAKRKRVKAAVVFEWFLLGFLPPPIIEKDSYCFSESAAEEFDRKYASLPEALKALGIKEPALLNWIAEGKINCAPGPHSEGGTAYLFCREDVEKLKGSELTTKSSRKKVKLRESITP